MRQNDSGKVSWLTFARCCDAQCTTCEGKPHNGAVRFLRARVVIRLSRAEREPIRDPAGLRERLMRRGTEADIHAS